VDATMSPERFRACLLVIGWSGQGFAKKIGVDERQVRRWTAGTGNVPPRIAEWLEQVAAFFDANPPPAGGTYKPRQPSQSSEI